MSSHAPPAHVGRDQFHLAWDRSIEPVVTVASGSVVEIDALDASPTRARRADQPVAAINATTSRRPRLRRAASRRRHVHYGLFAATLYVEATLSGRWPVDRPLV